MGRLNELSRYAALKKTQCNVLHEYENTAQALFNNAQAVFSFLRKKVLYAPFRSAAADRRRRDNEIIAGISPMATKAPPSKPTDASEMLSTTIPPITASTAAQLHNRIIRTHDDP
ncbi:hypothetical protein C161_22929 [Paenibacillus sp. FSL R5-192]|nr:hypothetical protein C161_22929 [Paenibacillus sp. FSL R5-192]